MLPNSWVVAPDEEARKHFEEEFLIKLTSFTGFVDEWRCGEQRPDQWEMLTQDVGGRKGKPNADPKLCLTRWPVLLTWSLRGSEPIPFHTRGGSQKAQFSRKTKLRCRPSIPYWWEEQLELVVSALERLAALALRALLDVRLAVEMDTSLLKAKR